MGDPVVPAEQKDCIPREISDVHMVERVVVSFDYYAIFNGSIIVFIGLVKVTSVEDLPVFYRTIVC